MIHFRLSWPKSSACLPSSPRYHLSDPAKSCGWVPDTARVEPPRLLPDQPSIFERFPLVPRSVFVAEVDALAERRMAGAPELVEQARARIAQILLLELHERRRAVVAV